VNPYIAQVTANGSVIFVYIFMTGGAGELRCGRHWLGGENGSKRGKNLVY
jgi:hypothetical protein